MAWAKFDDRYDDNRKIKRAWRKHPRAVGFHAMSITYCARHETDGLVDHEWVEEWLPVKKEREAVCEALVECGLFERADSGFIVHDFLRFNPSKADLEERRERDRLRKASGRSPAGVRSDSTRNPDGSNLDSRAPVGVNGLGRAGTDSSQGEVGNQTRAQLDEVIEILGAVPHWQWRIDESGVSNALSMHPNIEPAQAARLAVTWASDPTWQLPPAASLRSALRKLDAEKPKQDEVKATRKRRADALRTFTTSTEGGIA